MSHSQECSSEDRDALTLIVWDSIMPLIFIHMFRLRLPYMCVFKCCLAYYTPNSISL